jgi:hypothetical protein
MGRAPDELANDEAVDAVDDAGAERNGADTEE